MGRELILSFGIIKCEAPIRSLNWTENGKWLLIGESSRFAGVAVSRGTEATDGVNARFPDVRSEQLTHLWAKKTGPNLLERKA